MLSVLLVSIALAASASCAIAEGGKGIYNVHSYDKQAPFAQSLPTFTALADSFQFDSGYEYKPPSNFGGAWSVVLKSSIWGLIVGAIVGGVAAAVQALKKRKST